MIAPDRLHDAIREVRRPINFFKHADRDPHEILEFNPDLSAPIITVAIAGLRTIGERPTLVQMAYVMWEFLHSPELYGKDYLETVYNTLGKDVIEESRKIKRRDFLSQALQSMAQTQAR